MGTTSEGTAGYVEEDMQPKYVIGVLYLPLSRRDETLYVSINIQSGWKYYKGVIHNTYQFGYIETNHHVILSITKDIVNHFDFSKFTKPVSGSQGGNP